MFEALSGCKCSISLAAHRIIWLSVKSTTTFPLLRGYCSSALITQPRATHDHYPQSTDESAQKKLFACVPMVMPW